MKDSGRILKDDADAASRQSNPQSVPNRSAVVLEALATGVRRILTAVSVAAALPEVLGALAPVLRFERVTVAENIAQPSGPSLPNVLLSWEAPGSGTTPVSMRQLRSMCSEPELVQWYQPLSEGRHVATSRDLAPEAVRTFLTQLGAQASLAVPVLIEGRYWGQLSFDDCHDEYAWHGEDILALSTLAQVIGTALTRERHLAALAAADTIIQRSPNILYRLRGEPQLPMTYVSENIATLGYQSTQLLADPVLYRELIHPEDRERVHGALEALLGRDAAAATIEFRMLANHGGECWVESYFAPVRDADGRLVEVEGILTDISERKASESKIALLARSDALTGLANRTTFSDRLRQAFAAAQRGARAFAVLYLDLDRFKEVNDTLGHRAGDQLLQQVAQRLQRATRQIDTVARLGGDEFAIVQGDVRDAAAAGSLAEKLVEMLAAPYVVEGNDVRIGVSIGIALYNVDAVSPDALVAQADQALYRAKHAGRGQFRFHSDEIDHETREHLALADDLRMALAREELEIRYQPQVELATGRIVGMEALLRWNHPTRGLLLPEDFLPIAEKYGITQQLGRWTIDVACRQMSLWRHENLPVPVVAVNVALAQIKMGHEFVRDVTDSIARWNLTPSDVELDVTELVLARTTLTQSRVLDELRQLGVGIAIDDFGAQYSSLDYLRNYHVNRLKIARGMVAVADAEPGGRAMIRAILSMARELGVEVVAEGVETEAQRALLVDASARAQGQGFYYSRAVSAGETMEMLRSGIVLPEAR